MTDHPGHFYTVVMNIDTPQSHNKRRDESTYQIQLLGEVNPKRVEWFEEMGFQLSLNQGGSTTITGIVKDQSHLRGILNRIWDLNFTVILVKRLDKMIETGEKPHE